MASHTCRSLSNIPIKAKYKAVKKAILSKFLVVPGLFRSCTILFTGEAANHNEKPIGMWGAEPNGKFQLFRSIRSLPDRKAWRSILTGWSGKFRQISKDSVTAVVCPFPFIDPLHKHRCLRYFCMM